MARASDLVSHKNTLEKLDPNNFVCVVEKKLVKMYVDQPDNVYYADPNILCKCPPAPPCAYKTTSTLDFKCLDPEGNATCCPGTTRHDKLRKAVAREWNVPEDRITAAAGVQAESYLPDTVEYNQHAYWQLRNMLGRLGNPNEHARWKYGSFNDKSYSINGPENKGKMKQAQAKVVEESIDEQEKPIAEREWKGMKVREYFETGQEHLLPPEYQGKEIYERYAKSVDRTAERKDTKKPQLKEETSTADSEHQKGEITMGGYNPSSLCRQSIQPGDLVYKCRDCGLDDSCILCGKCFSHSEHQKHNYASEKGIGGFCDCGDPESFNPHSTCQLHLNNDNDSSDDDDGDDDDDDDDCWITTSEEDDDNDNDDGGGGGDNNGDEDDNKDVNNDVDSIIYKA